MEKIIANIKKLIRFKQTTELNDIVLIVAKHPQLLVYAMVSAIARDENRQDEWWRVTFRLLTFPPQELTWILRKEQFTGREVFTMDGKERFVAAIDFSDAKKDRKKGGVLKLVKK